MQVPRDSHPDAISDSLDAVKRERVAVGSDASTVRELRGADEVDLAKVRQAFEALHRAFPLAEGDSLFSQLGQGDLDGSAPELNAMGFLDRFEIERLLGKGGFAEVYLARDRRLGRRVAVKVFDAAAITCDRFQSQFMFEVQTMAGLRHPGLVPIFDAGAEGALWYLVMEYVEGPTLATWLTADCHGPLPFHTSAAIVAQVAEAVDYAHAHGCLHCDIKPSNILLERRSPGADAIFPYSPRLSDFGLARRLEDPASASWGGAMAGTPRYMAPEQATSRPGELTVQTDVYGLGAVLFELMTGASPFAEISTKEWFLRVGREWPRGLHSDQRRIPADLAAICRKCLSPTPEQRYRSAADLRRDLLHFTHGAPVTARPLGRPARLMRWARRRPLVASLTLALAASLAAGVAGMGWLYQRERTQRRFAEAKHRVARQAVDDIYGVFSEKWLREKARMDPVLREFTEKALAFYEGEARATPLDADALYGLQTALHRSANCLHWLDRHADAVRQRRRCLTVIDQLLVLDPTSYEYRFARFHNLLLLSGHASDLDESLEIADAAHAQIRQLLDENPHDFEVLEAAVSSALCCARLYGRKASVEHRARYAAEAEELAGQLESTFGENPKAIYKIAECYLQLSGDMTNGRSVDECLQLVNRAERLLDKLTQEDDRRLSVRTMRMSAGLSEAYLECERRRFDNAASAMDRAIVVQQAIAEDFPDRSGEREVLAQLQFDRARLHWLLGRRAEARVLLATARQTMQSGRQSAHGVLSAVEGEWMVAKDSDQVLEKAAQALREIGMQRRAAEGSSNYDTESEGGSTQ